MNTLSRGLILLMALFSVSALGYYAYSLTSQTLSLPFIGSENQYGDVLEVPFSPPVFQLGSAPNELLDTGAILSSFTRGGQSVSLTVSGEYTYDIRPNYIRITNLTPEKNNTPPLVLSADVYNTLKKTPYTLPKDISLTSSDVPKSLEFDMVGEPRNQVYNISLYGLSEYNPDSIRYYAHYNPTWDCAISSWGFPAPYMVYGYDRLKSAPGVSGEDPVLLPKPLSPWIYEDITAHVLTPSSRDGQKWISQIRLPYDLSQSRVCIIAGVRGEYRVIEDRALEPFIATGGLIQALSPEHDMQSRIEFRFSEDIYRDVGVLYSPEYIAHRQEAKIAFLKNLRITPNIDVSPDNLILTPDRAILTLPLKDGEEYAFELQDISDIYGRKTEVRYTTKLEAKPFLSLRLADDKQIYTPTEEIDAKLYALLPAKNTYTLKLCRVSLDMYARLERIIENPSRVDNTYMPALLAGSEVSDCRKKDIILGEGSYVAPFRVSDFFLGDAKKTGLYVLSFALPEDTASFTGFISPILFSLVDTHLTMKVDASGKMMVLATDIKTGKPLPGEKITLLRNISRTHSEKWDPQTGKTEKIYIPLTSQAFATGIIIGNTNEKGFLDKKVDTLPGIDGYSDNPYGLSFESWWDYEGRYDSFIVESRSENHLGYLVSTWNDGITGYNFGIKDSDYSYSNRPLYTSYLHTDRRLYLPGETVHIHAILRKNSASLTIPSDVPFDIVVTDPLGKEIKRSTLKSNEFGSIGLDIEIPKSAPLGSYSISLATASNTEYIENGWTNFQVEVFKNPTFTASVELRSPDIEKETIRDLRKTTNIDPYTPWYKDVYTGNFTIEGIVKARYYNGADIKNTSFTYRVYKSDYFDQDYFGDCFWGCYYEPTLEQYTDGTGSIDSDGFGIIRIPVDFRSFYSDYKYTVEVTIRDALTGEEVTTPGSLLVRLPESYKSFSPENALEYVPKKKILNLGEGITGTLKPKYGKWDKSLIGKYRYEIIHREYREAYIDDIRSGKMRITSTDDRVVASGAIVSETISDKMLGMKPGEYHMKTYPIVDSGTPPETSVADTIFYIAGDTSTLKDSTLRVIPERTIYKVGETAKVLIQVPFTGSHLLITREKGGVISREYTYLTGNTLTREYPIDDTMIPNAYIGVVALRTPDSSGSQRSYSVGYGEIITDMADKKALLTLSPNKSTYKNRETVTLDMTLTDRVGNPLQGEVTLMVVDESLIRLLGNIDLDILPKFYQKYPFTVKTALSAIGIERNRFLSRRGSSGGSGDKGGGGDQVSSRTLFQNTAYYNPSVRTDISGKAKVSFPLPDNVTDYRIIAIANTTDTKFAVAENTIEVRKDYVLESAAPQILHAGDTFTIMVTAFNNTKRVTPVDVILSFGTGSTRIEKTSTLSLDALDKKGTSFRLTLPTSSATSIPYTITLREKDVILDSITHSISLPTLPVLTPRIRLLSLFTGSVFTQKLPKSDISNTDTTLSRVDVSVSTNFAPQIASGISSLLQYPYGCIEQTIASTLPNRIALSLAANLKLPLDMKLARENTKVGLEKILSMQHMNGGWVYWQGDFDANIHITPYVLRSLLRFQELGESIPSDVYENGKNYILSNEAEYRSRPDDFAEAIWTLALLKESRALLWWSDVDTSKLSRHGYLAYIYAAQKLGRYTADMDSKFRTLLSTRDPNSYWTLGSDTAIYAQLLLDRQDRDGAMRLIDPLVRATDLTSYYISTQEKIQTLIALLRLSKDNPALTEKLDIALRADAVIADIGVSPESPTNSLNVSREQVGESYTLKRANNKTPLYITTQIRDRPKDITTLRAYSTGGIKLSRTFESIDESKGVDEGGEFIVRYPVKDNTFQKGKLYRVTLRVDTPGRYQHLSIEDFFPGGWRPINNIFQTEQSRFSNQDGSSWWDHREFREDRLLAYRQYSTDVDTLTYTYYIRPESLGEYLLPPATAYFMYAPEIHAYTQYARVQVVE